MPPASKAAARFVRALLPHGEARRGRDDVFRLAAGGRVASLKSSEVAALVSAGVLSGDAVACRPAAEAVTWLRRQLLGADGHAGQHRHEVRRSDGTLINLDESPLARLAVAVAGEAQPFLEPQHVEAGERVRRLTERAQLQPRLTMSYDPTRTASGKAGSAGGPAIGDMAAEARQALDEIMRVLPRDCAEVVFDVCGLLKGLQLIETERAWPRRSAKLVLRIGLDHLARHYGLDRAAVGRQRRGVSAWRDGDRPAMFDDGGASPPAG